MVESDHLRGIQTLHIKGMCLGETPRIFEYDHLRGIRKLCKINDWTLVKLLKWSSTITSGAYGSYEIKDWTWVKLLKWLSTITPGAYRRYEIKKWTYVKLLYGRVRSPQGHTEVTK